MTTTDVAPTVLLVEDEPEFVLRLRDAANSLDGPPAVLHFDCAGAALDWAAAAGQAPQLALVDLGLPDRPGITVIEGLRERWPDLAILVVSVLASQQQLFAAIRAGARGYIVKTDTSLTLADGMRQALAGVYPLSAPLARYLFRLVDSGAPPDSLPGGTLPALSERERQVLELLSRGLGYEQAAQKLGIALSTVQTHIRSLYRKLDVHTQAHAVNKALKHGLIDPA